MEMLREGLLALLEILWKLSVQGSFCIVLVLLIRQLLRKAPRWCSYVLWSVVFLRLICPVFPEGSFSLMPRQLQMSTKHVLMQEEESALDSNYGAVVAVEDVVIDNTGIALESMLSPEKMDKQVAGGSLVERQDILPNTQLPKNHRETMLVGMTIIWILGGIGLAFYHIMSYQLLKRRMRMAVKKEDGIYEVQGEHLSFVMGIIKPKIYLSMGLDEQMRNVILCHERVHLQRKDYIFKPLALGICCVHWWNPLVWLAFYLMNKDCEMSCDEKVVALLGEESKTVYSYALLNEATNGDWFKNRRGSVCALLSFGEDHVKNRITHVLRYKKASVSVICCAVVVLVVLGVGLCLNPKEKETEGEDIATVEEVSLIKQEEVGEQLEMDTLDEFSESDEYAKIVLALETHARAYEEETVEPRVRDWTTLVRLEDTSTAMIRYIMESTVPEYYIAEETVKLELSEDGYLVNRVSYHMYTSVNSVAEMEAVYDWKNGEGIKSIYYPAEYVSAVRDHIINETDSEYYSAYQDPYTAAKTILHLGADKREAGMNQVVKHILPKNSSVSKYGEGTVCYVHYYFEDGSKAEIPMVLVEESVGIWMPVADDYVIEDGEVDANKKQYNTRVIYDSCQVGDVTYQLTNLGIYKETEQGVEFVYSSVSSSSAKLAYDDGKLYFPTDKNYYEGALDWCDNSICVVDIQTKQVGYIDLPQAAQNVFPLSAFRVEDGYITLWNYDDMEEFTMILEDVHPVYNGKLATELDEAEKQTYASMVTEQVLSNPSQVFAVGHHTKNSTFAYLDLNHDGQIEEVAVTKNSNEGYTPMDSFILSVDDWSQEYFGESQVNEIYAWSPDGEEIMVILYEDGPSGDPLSSFFYYDNGSLKEAGMIALDVRTATIENVIISSAIRQDVIQTDWIKVSYRINDKGMVEVIEQETYDFIGLNDVELKQTLKLYTKPNGSKDTCIEMQPQTVHITKTDKNFEWVLIEANDGTMGWIRVKDILYVGDDEVMSDELFEGLCFAG